MTIAAFATARVVGSEFCRYYPPASTIPVRLTPVGTPDGTEVVTITLVEEATGTAVATKTTSGATRMQATIDLTVDCFDPRYLGRTGHPDQHIYRARYGWYHVTATATTAGTVTATISTARFPILPVSVAELREKFLYGIPDAATQVVAPVAQPIAVTGVTIVHCSPDFYKGQYTLTYTSGGSPSLQLTSDSTFAGWDAIPTPLDPNGGGDVILRVARTPDSDYVVARYDGWSLPGSSTTEILTFDSAMGGDDALAQRVIDAARWCEGRAGFYLEPTRVTTDLDLDAAAHKNDATPQLYEAPPANSLWLSTMIPHRPILSVDALVGRLNDGTVLAVNPEWHVVNRLSGRVSLVPANNSTINWLLYGPLWIQFLGMGFPRIPNFWHYNVVSGVSDLGDGQYAFLRELVMKRALVEILLAVGRAQAGGLASENASKDGISTSRPYAGGGVPYKDDIDRYTMEVESGLSAARQRILGVVSVSFQ